MAAPLHWCHLNGEQLPLSEARISPLDRSFLFGDGVYEVLRVYGGRLFRPQAHLDRLDRSAGAIRLVNPHTDAQWLALLEELVAANGGGDQYVYLQLSRGAEWGRNHAPLPDIPPTVFAYCSPWPQVAESTLRDGLVCITGEDTRWARCDIKSVALLANVLLRQLACDAGASETILLRDGKLTEGSASTVHVVRDGVLLTPLNSTRILPGTTRGVVEELADGLGIPRRDAHISEAELRTADEIWLAAATREVQPVTKLDGKPVGAGVPGPLWRRVYDAYQQLKRAIPR
ncbi:MAG TPA: D-amino acid aminotransferase [Steroidobacteraceae bacterium]|nr:D-amino acid aminotransferase [Steroidobacteraceae bacterium]